MEPDPPPGREREKERGGRGKRKRGGRKRNEKINKRYIYVNFLDDIFDLSFSFSVIL